MFSHIFVGVSDFERALAFYRALMPVLGIEERFCMPFGAGPLIHHKTAITGGRMYTTISAQRLSTGSVYKLWFIGLLASMVPLGVFFGVLAFFGFDTVSWNGQPLHGLTGLLLGPVLGGFVALMFTAMLGSAAALGLWLYSKFRPIALAAKNVA